MSDPTRPGYRMRPNSQTPQKARGMVEAERRLARLNRPRSKAERAKMSRYYRKTLTRAYRTGAGKVDGLPTFLPELAPEPTPVSVARAAGLDTYPHTMHRRMR